MNSELTLEDLSRRLKNLSPAEKTKLRALLGDEWFKSMSEEESKTIQALLEKSRKQLQRKEGRSVDNILQESRKKYGI